MAHDDLDRRAYHREWVRPHPPEATRAGQPGGGSMQPGVRRYGDGEREGRMDGGGQRSWLRTLVGSVIVGVIILVGQWWSRTEQLTEKARALRDDNETKALAWLTLPEPPTEPDNRAAPIVRAIDLVNAYRDSPSGARQAYTGRRVRVPLRHGVVRGNEVHWHLGDPALPALVTFEFVEPPKEIAGVAWVVGTCAGPVKDGGGREEPSYDFRVRLADCKIVR